MAHKKIIDSVKKQGQVTIKDLDEFLRFVINEYDMRTLNNNYISILISMQLDVNKVFGLDVCKRSDDDYVILYRDRQGRLVLDDIHDLPEVVEKVFAGHPEFTHTFFHEGN